MPTYSYRCKHCGHQYEAFQSMSEAAHSDCPECKGQVERLIGGGAGIVFKGSGFYVTDYRKSSSNSGGGKGESSAGAATPASGAASPSPSTGASSSNSSSSSSSGAAS
ncbi:MAG: zinc ribbon domain-containing protein [Leptospirales bacterium]|nr:zinc ribbon domain-containing protein [Leptospirales bacterium]